MGLLTATSAEAQVIAIEHATLIDGTGAAPAGEVTIVLENGRIRDVGPSASLQPPASAEVVDATGKFVVPGIINAHGHVGENRDPQLRQYAQYGWWKVRVYRKHPSLFRIRHLVPAAFVLSLPVSVAGAFALRGIAWVAPATLLGTYLAAATISGIAGKVSPLRLPGLALVFFLIHVAYGGGFLAGLISLLAPAARGPDGES